jgi:ligand-binding sensor domain-containing protein
MKCTNLFLPVLIALILSAFGSPGKDAKSRMFHCDSQQVNVRLETDRYCWIGTNHGLYCIRKKGNRVSHMTTGNSILLSDTVTCIVACDNGDVYIGTPNGIVRYDGYAFLMITTENSTLKSNRITSLMCVNGDEVFAGTYGGGITVFSGYKSKTYTSKNTSMANDYVLRFEKAGGDSLVAVLDQDFRVGISNRQFNALNIPVK